MTRRTVLGLAGFSILAVSYLALALIFPSLPEFVPVHWNGSGVADGYMGKPWIFLAMALPSFAPTMALIFSRAEQSLGSGRRGVAFFDLALTALFFTFLAFAWLSVFSSFDVADRDPDGFLSVLLGSSYVALGWGLRRSYPRRLSALALMTVGALNLGAVFAPPTPRALVATSSVFAFVGLAIVYAARGGRGDREAGAGS